MLRAASLTDSLPHLLGIEANHAHEGRSPAQQGWRRMHALDSQQHLQAIEQDILEDWDHLARGRRALNVAQPVAHHQLLQEVETVVRERAFVQLGAPYMTCLRYRRRVTRESSRLAACEHKRSAMCC